MANEFDEHESEPEGSFRTSWSERLFGLVLAAAGGTMLVGIWRMIAGFKQPSAPLPAWVDLVMIGVMLPFTSIPAAFLFIGLRHLIGERRWIERTLTRLKLGLVLWITVIGGGLLLFLTIHAIKFWFGP